MRLSTRLYGILVELLQCKMYDIYSNIYAIYHKSGNFRVYKTSNLSFSCTNIFGYLQAIRKCNNNDLLLTGGTSDKETTKRIVFIVKIFCTFNFQIPAGHPKNIRTKISRFILFFV